MEGEGKRIQRESQISDLPQSVLESILGSLSISDAVRAGLVSRTWCDGWKFTRVLSFNRDFYLEFIEGTDHRLDAVVNSILSCHSGQVSRFYFFVPHSIPDEIPVDISEGIRILSEKQVEKLTINVCREIYLELPPAIFNFSKLLHLELHHCQISEAVDFRGFRNLRYLILQEIVVADHFIYLMISQSPQLHYLELEFYMDGSPVEVRHEAPANLDTLFYHCKEGCTRPLRLTTFPNLTNASFETELQLLGCPPRTCRLEYFVSLIPQVGCLSLNAPALTSLADEDVPVRLATKHRFMYDLNLDLIDIGSDTMLSVAFCLIRSAPKLRSINVHVDQDDVDHDAALSILQEQLRLPPLRRIHTLSIDNLINTDIEVALIETLIRLCPNLKAVYLKPSECTEREDEEELYNELRQIRLPETAAFEFEWVDRWMDE